MTPMQIIGLIGFVLDISGKLLVAYMSIMVHRRFRHEHSIDDEVFLAMRREEVFGLLGMLLMLTGASFELMAMMSRI